LPRSTTGHKKFGEKFRAFSKKKKSIGFPKHARLEARNFLIYLGSCEKHCFTVGHESVHLGHENQHVLFYNSTRNARREKNCHSCWIFCDRVTKEELEEEIVDGWILGASLDCSE